MAVVCDYNGFNIGGYEHFESYAREEGRSRLIVSWEDDDAENDL
jgi:hypothetical protein